MACSLLASCSSGKGTNSPEFNPDASAGSGAAMTGNGGGGRGVSGAPSDGGAAGAGGSNATGGGGSVDPTASPRAACRAYLQAACQRIEECGRPSVSCSRLLDLCPDYFFSPGSTRTLTELSACAREWATFPCGDVYLGGSPPCATPGARKAGEPCFFASQCESLACSANVYDAPLCGTCLPLAAPGGTCSVDAIECPPGQYCTSGTCAPASPRDPLPPPGGPGDSCTSQCVPGYACQGVSGSIAHCEPAPGPGSPCAGSSGLCSADAYCNMSNVCVTLPGVGEACGFAAQSGGAKCEMGTLCDNATVQCIPRVPLGETCRPAYTECIEDTDCTSVTGTPGQPAEYRCQRTVEEGQACTDPNDRCVAATTCQSGRCVAVGDLGLFGTACGP